MRSVVLAFILGFTVVTAVMPAASQTPAQKPAFDVISVKVNKSGTFEGTTVGIRGSTFSAINATLRMLI